MTTSERISAGGGAFPDNECGVGMTLRDFFAAHALTGMIATHTPEEMSLPRADDAAEYAYRCADAMLEARRTPTPQPAAAKAA
jgi:hypothetical protein